MSSSILPCVFQVCEKDEFCCLLKDQLVQILFSEDLRIEDEFQVFSATMRWLMYELSNRKKHLVQILEPVRFPLLCPQRLLNYIQSENADTHQIEGGIRVGLGWAQRGLRGAWVGLGG